jgi:hypothetical protein
MENKYPFPAQRARALVCRLYDNIVRSSPPALETVLTDTSVLIPWITLREVPVEVEIVSQSWFHDRTQLISVISHHRKWQYSSSIAECNKVSWVELVAPRSWSTMPSELSVKGEKQNITI